MEILLDKKNIIEFNSKCANISYKIKISLLSDKINFEIKSKNKNFSKNFIYENFQTLSNLFTIFDNIEEIFQCIKDIKLHKKPDLILREKKIYLKIYPNLGKYNFIEIPLETDNDIKTIKVDENFLNQIEEDIKMFDSFINSYEHQIKELENENKELQLKTKNNKELILDNNKYNNIFYYNINNSYENFVLIHSQYESIKFNELLIKETNFNICDLIIPKFKNKKINFKLIYKAKIDGDKAKNFHNNVDGKGPLIILIKTSNNIIIGGYTSKIWSSSNKYMKDSDAFLFSFIKKLKIYKINNPDYACFHFENEGPCFGNNGELFIVDNCFTKDSWANNYSKSYNINEKNLIDKKDIFNFKVSDYEVYEIVSYN